MIQYPIHLLGSYFLTCNHFSSLLIIILLQFLPPVESVIVVAAVPK